MIVTLSDRARIDLVGIGEYIAADDSIRAATFVDELLTACDGLADFPRAYPVDPRFGPAIRRRGYGNYLIVYEISDDGILILTIVHAARDHGPLS